jgi:hypothetical protein
LVILISLIPAAMILSLVFEDIVEKRRRARERKAAARP